jgi:hypothetical protein
MASVVLPETLHANARGAWRPSNTEGPIDALLPLSIFETVAFDMERLRMIATRR